MLCDKILQVDKGYDDFILYSSLIRKNAKDLKEIKNELINFVCNEDFKFIYEKWYKFTIIEMNEGD